MLIEILIGVGAFVVGTIVGALVYRNNADDGEATILYLESQSERLNVELREALDELAEAKAKLTRKPKAK